MSWLNLICVSRVWAYSFLTNRDWGDLFVLLSSKISDQAAGIITWHRTHKHWSAGLHLQIEECQRQVQQHWQQQMPLESKSIEGILVYYLAIHNISQVKRLLDDAHEGLSQHLWDKNVRHGKQTVRAEGLNQQQLVHCLANGSWTGKSRAGNVYTECIHQHLNQYLLGLNVYASFAKYDKPIYSLDCFSSDHR